MNSIASAVESKIADALVRESGGAELGSAFVTSFDIRVTDFGLSAIGGAARASTLRVRLTTVSRYRGHHDRQGKQGHEQNQDTAHY
jgi:hypothetical protein